MTKQKQIEDYPELQDWVENKVRLTVLKGRCYYRDSDVESKLLEMQQQIDSLTEQNKELLTVVKSADEYLDTNELTTICHNSNLHKAFKDLNKESK